MMTLSYSCDLLSHPKQKLADHLLAVAQGAKSRAHEAPLQLTIVNQQAMEELAWIVGACHDLGKATRRFQEYVRETVPAKKAQLKAALETHHALLSAIFALPWLDMYLNHSQVSSRLKPIVKAIAFEAIRRHHGNLSEILNELSLTNYDYDIITRQISDIDPACFNQLLSKLGYTANYQIDNQLFIQDAQRQLREMKREIRNYIAQTDCYDSSAQLELFFLSAFLFSTLLDADKKAAAELPGAPGRGALSDNTVDKYRQQMGWGQPIQGNPIFQIRDELYEQILHQLPTSGHSKLFTLTAPTGAGKTLAALSFALKLKEKIRQQEGYTPRIIYCLPFLSIIDQNYQVFTEVLQRTGIDTSHDLLLAHHHLSDSTYKTKEDEYDPDVANLLIEGWESEIIVTTFVQLFFTMIGNRNRPLRRFHKLAGAIVILDEVQCFPHHYWLLFRKAAETLVEGFGTRFLLMTATQPLIFAPNSYVELVPGHQSFYSRLQRVTLRCNLQQTVTLDDLTKRAAKDIDSSGDKSFLFILNTIRAAEEFHTKLAALLGKNPEEIQFMSSRVIPKHRLERIKGLRQATNSPKPWIAVTTQLVEAGIDLDADVVYRDFGPMDTIIQASGRCNRNGLKRDGRVEVFEIVDDNGRSFASYVYDGFLLRKTKDALQSVACLDEPQFLQAVQHYYGLVAQGQSQDASRKYLCDMLHLNFDEVSGFRLIEETPEVDVFVEADDDAKCVWQKYSQIVGLKDPLQRKQEFMKIRRDFHQYLVSLPSRAFEQNPIPVENNVGYVSSSDLGRHYNPVTGLRIGAQQMFIW